MGIFAQAFKRNIYFVRKRFIELMMQTEKQRVLKCDKREFCTAKSFYSRVLATTNTFKPNCRNLTNLMKLYVKRSPNRFEKIVEKIANRSKNFAITQKIRVVNDMMNNTGLDLIGYRLPT